MAQSSIVHGCLVEIDGTGVLIVGDPESGKTTVCLELARLGHDFIADDAVAISANALDVTGSAPAETASVVAIRGVGFRRLTPRRASVPIGLVIELIADGPNPATLSDSLRSVRRCTIRRITASETAAVIESLVKRSSHAAA